MSSKVKFSLKDKRNLSKEYNLLNSLIEKEFNSLDSRLQDEIINSTDVGYYKILGAKRHVFLMYVNSIANFSTKSSLELEYNYFKSLNEVERKERYKGIVTRNIKSFDDFLIYFNYTYNEDIANLGMINRDYGCFNHIELVHVVNNATSKYAMKKLENKEVHKFNLFEFANNGLDLNPFKKYLPKVEKPKGRLLNMDDAYDGFLETNESHSLILYLMNKVNSELTNDLVTEVIISEGKNNLIDINFKAKRGDLFIQYNFNDVNKNLFNFSIHGEGRTFQSLRLDNLIIEDYFRADFLEHFFDLWDVRNICIDAIKTKFNL